MCTEALVVSPCVELFRHILRALKYHLNWSCLPFGCQKVVVFFELNGIDGVYTCCIEGGGGNHFLHFNNQRL